MHVLLRISLSPLALIDNSYSYIQLNGNTDRDTLSFAIKPSTYLLKVVLMVSKAILRSLESKLKSMN